MSLVKKYKGHSVYHSVDGYQFIYLPKHHLAQPSNGSVPLHRLIAEEYILKRTIKSEEVVHHKDFNKSNNNVKNLMVFESDEDHAAYHKAIEYKLNYLLMYTNGVYKCTVLPENINTNKSIKFKRYRNTCKECGTTISDSASLCLKCLHNKQRKIDKNIVTKKVLQEYFNQGESYESIGRRYNVSGNTIKTLALNYKVINPRSLVRCLDVNKLCELLKNNSLQEVAKSFNVSADTIKTWIKQNNIEFTSNLYKVQCLESGKIYNSRIEASKEVYPEWGVFTASWGITLSIRSGNDYKGYTWRNVENIVKVNGKIV